MKPLIDAVSTIEGLLVDEIEKFAPDLVAKGRMQIANARVMGHLTVQMGAAELARRIGPIRTIVEEALVNGGLIAPDVDPAPAGDDDETGAAAATPSRPSGASAPKRRAAGTRAAPGGATSSKKAVPRRTPGTVTLAIADYDTLAASQIVQRLASLDPAELDAICAHELANRGRKTILGRIAQLQR